VNNESKSKETHVVVYADYGLETVVWVGTKEECEEYEDSHRKALTNADYIKKDYYVTSLSKFCREENRSRTAEFREYVRGLTAEQKAETIVVNGKETLKFVYDFRKLISIREYANKIEVSSAHIRRKVESGEIPQAIKLGRTWLIPSDVKWSYA